MPFIQSGGSVEVQVQSGQRILVTSYGAGQTKIQFSALPEPYTQTLRAITVIENGSYLSPVFTATQEVVIDAAVCEVEYVIAASPVATKERYQPGSVAITGGSVNGTPVGATTASTGAFTTLSASSTVSGTGFSNYLAAPPAIGGTTAAAGSFTNLSSSGTVSGTGFSNYLAVPPAIGGTTPNTGSFTNLASSGTVSGSGFSNYFASPPAIGGTAANTGSFTTLSATGALTANGANVNHSLAPTGTGNVTLGAAGTGSTTRTRLNSLTVLSSDTSGTPGNATINNLSGRAAFAAAGSTVVITNSTVTANSKVFVSLRAGDATLTTVRVTPAAGSFTVTGNAAATAITIFDFLVVN